MKQNRIFNSIKVASFCGMTVLTALCSDDFFDVKNPNEISSSTFWKTESDALMALTGCYDAMQNGDLNNDYIDGWKIWFFHPVKLVQIMVDTLGVTGCSVPRLHRGTSTANDQCFSKYWNANYELIKRCNALLENVDEISMSDDKEGCF